MPGQRFADHEIRHCSGAELADGGHSAGTAFHRPYPVREGAARRQHPPVALDVRAEATLRQHLSRPSMISIVADRL